MKIQYRHISAVAIALATILSAASLQAASFIISTADTAAKTLGSTSGQTGLVNSGASLTVNGATVAVTITGNNETLTNLGTISQTGTGRIIRDNTGVTGLVINNGSSTNSTALMQAADADVIQMNKPSASVTFNNYGTLTSLNASKGGSQAIDFNAITSGSNILNNYAGGIIQASEADAVRPGVNGVVNNDGLIKSTTTTGSSSDGIDAQANTGITIVNAASAGVGTGTGTIEGARHGITGGNTATDGSGNPTVSNGAYSMSITNNLGGTIQGDNGSGINIDGLNANETVTIINHGIITGNGRDLGDGSAHDGDGVDIDGVVNITNTGTIKSINAFGGALVGGVQPIENSEGITVGGGIITNSGLIQGSVAAGNTTAIGRGITIAGVDKLITNGGAGNEVDTSIPVQAPYAATTITNQTGGQIIGDSDSAIIFSSALASGFSHTINNQAGASIQTGSTSAPAILTAADYVTINNAGTIDGSTSGKAITMGTAGGTVHVTGGSAVVNGNVDGGNASVSSANFDPGAGNIFSYSGALSNFHDVTISTGNVILSGASTYSGNTTVSGTLTVTNVTGSATGTGTVFVNLGGTLNGTGTVGAVSIASGGILAPGLSPGTLNINGTLDLVAGSHLAFDLGSTSDLLNISGALGFTGTGTALFDILNTGSMTAGSDYTLMNYSSSSGLSLANMAFGSTPAGFSGAFTLGATSLTLHVNSVPEPSRALLGLLGFTLVSLRRRQTKQRQ